MSLNKQQQQQHKTGTTDPHKVGLESPTTISRGRGPGQQQISTTARSRPGSVETQRSHNSGDLPQQAKRPSTSISREAKVQPDPRQRQRPPQMTSIGKIQPSQPRINQDPVSGAKHPARPGLPSVSGQRQTQTSTATLRQVDERSKGGSSRSSAGSQQAQRNQNQAINGSVQVRISQQSTSESTRLSKSQKSGYVQYVKCGLGLVQQYPDPNKLCETNEADVE